MARHAPARTRPAARLRVEPLDARLTPAAGDLLQTLANPSAAAFAQFGTAVAVDGDLAVVGSEGTPGRAFVYNLATRQLVATLNNPAPTQLFDSFGLAVAISGNRVVVGAGSAVVGGVARAGKAYVFDVSSGATPAPVATLTHPTPAVDDRFGSHVAISGSRVVVGADGDDVGGFNSVGSAHLFDVAATPNRLATISNPTPANDELFGGAVAIDGTRVVVAANETVAGQAGSGTVYVFDVATTPALAVTLNNPAPTRLDGFGGAVAISGTRVVVGVPGFDVGSKGDAGAAYVFDLTAGPAPTPAATLASPTPDQNANFGDAVAISGTKVVVGASVQSALPLIRVGGAYLFDLAVGSGRAATFANPAKGDGDTFGNAVAISGSRVVVGARSTDGPSATTDAGAAYLFDAGGAVSPPPPPGPGPVGNPARQTAVGAGSGSGAVRVLNADGSEAYALAPFGADFAGGVRTAAADFTGDGVADLVVGTGPGRATRVRVLDGATRAEVFALDPFEAAFTGGVFVAVGDITGDGRPELVISPDEGGGPRVRVFSGAGFGQLADFFGIDDPNFRGGARAAVGDLDADGRGDLVVAAGFGGGPRVAGFSGAGLRNDGGPKLFADFFAFEQTLRNGIFIAAGDTTGDGRAELIAGGGPGGGPRVSVFSGSELVGGQQVRLADYFAGDANARGGVRLAVKNLDGDTRADVVAGDGTAGTGVRAYAGATLTGGSPPTLFDLNAFPGFAGGVFIG